MENRNLLKLIALANELNSKKTQDIENIKETFNKLENIFKSLSYDTSEKKRNVDRLENQHTKLKKTLIENQILIIEMKQRINNETNFQNIIMLRETNKELKETLKKINNEIDEIKLQIDENKNSIKAQRYIQHVFYFGVIAYAHKLYNNKMDFKHILENIEYKYSPYFYHQAIYLTIHSFLNIPFDYNDSHYKCRGKIARIVVSSSDSSLSLEIPNTESFLVDEILENSNKYEINYKQILALIKIQNLSLALLAYIEIDFSSYSERKVAHYTNLHVANKLLTGTSPIRLNSTNFMNDPLEGFALNNFFNIQIDNDINPHSHTFLTCFTFNHNSLNQFRLYGNIKNIECSGLSIVYDEHFFSSSKSNSHIHPEKLRDFKPNKLPLFRCIYIDPISGFIKIAQRSDFSFFQEYKDFKTAKNNLEKYKENILKLEENVQNILFEIKNIINSIHEESLIISKNINLILKSIKFLFKHFSFQEEQECRIIRTENIESNNVIYDKKTQRSFIEYNTLDDKSYIRNVYIGKAAGLYLTNLIKNISSSPKDLPKIKISENPYNVIEMLKDINLD